MPVIGIKRSISSMQEGSATRRGQQVRTTPSLGPAPKSCRYIHNEDPRNPDYCGNDVLEGKSYCPKHYEACHRKRVKRGGRFYLVPLGLVK